MHKNKRKLNENKDISKIKSLNLQNQLKAFLIISISSSFSELVFAQLIKIVVGQLLHKGFIWFNLVYVFPEKCKTVLELHFLLVDEVCQDESWCPTLSLNRLNKDGAILDSIIDESAGNSEVFCCVFSDLILNWDIQIFEIFTSFCVLFA